MPTSELQLAGDDRYRALVESVKDYAIFLLDPQGIIVSWNEGARRAKGYEENEVLGKHFSIFYPPEVDPQAHTKHELEVATSRGRFEEEGWRVRKDGSRFWANVVITALRSSAGELIGFSKVTRDLTERRRLEDERVQRAKAEEALRLRDEFLAIAAHELRTPLTALNLGLQQIQRSIAPDAPVQSKVARATRAASRMKDLIESLLEASRIATGRFTLAVESFDLAVAISDLADGMQPAADSAKASLTTKLQPLLITGDRVRISQVVTNLVSNALKYGAGAPVEISLRRENEEAIIDVRDHGPGIPAKDLARIFDRFERAASIANFGGLGLGLYIAREIVEAHGGSISAANAPDGGAHLVVRLPLEAKTQGRA